MSSNSDDVKVLKDKIAKLEARLDEFIASHRRTMRLAGECDDLLAVRCDIADRELDDVRQRVGNIEIKYFPKLRKDLARLDGIIGDGEPKAYNPLDFRKERHNRLRPPRK